MILSAQVASFLSASPLLVTLLHLLCTGADRQEAAEPDVRDGRRLPAPSDDRGAARAKDRPLPRPPLRHCQDRQGLLPVPRPDHLRAVHGPGGGGPQGRRGGGLGGGGAARGHAEAVHQVVLCRRNI